jgi:hypothetical protein
VRRLAWIVAASAIVFPAASAQAALPGRDYEFTYFKGADQSVLLDIAGRRSLGEGIGFATASGCVPRGTNTIGKAIGIARSGTFEATRALESVESGRTVGKAVMRGRFTSRSRLVLRTRFTSSRCHTREYRFVLHGRPPSTD